MPYDPFKHHRRSIRLRGYDYSQVGACFVTMCTHNRDHLFGEIVKDGEMSLNDFGQIIREEWLRSKEILKEIELDEWIITLAPHYVRCSASVPNHVHGIVIITVGAQGIAPNHDMGDAPDAARAGATGRSPLRTQPRGPTPRSLGSFVAGFKSSVTTRINQMRDTVGAPIWQRDYYEQIIRNEREWNAIAKYIRDNPTNWRADLDNPANFPKRPPPKTADEYWRDAGM